jgi:hypothetical protein
MRKPKVKRITVSIDIDIPVEMNIGETDKWVEGCFPVSARAQCNEQRAALSFLSPTCCTRCGGAHATWTCSDES